MSYLEEQDLANHVRASIASTGLSDSFELPLIERDVWHWWFHNQVESIFRYYVIVNPKLSREVCESLQHSLELKGPWGEFEKKNVHAMLICPSGVKLW